MTYRYLNFSILVDVGSGRQSSWKLKDALEISVGLQPGVDDTLAFVKLRQAFLIDLNLPRYQLHMLQVNWERISPGCHMFFKTRTICRIPQKLTRVDATHGYSEG